MSGRWYLRHPQGYWSAEGRGDLPTDLGISKKETAGILFDDDGQLEEVRVWNGKAWRLASKQEREEFVGWLASQL